MENITEPYRFDNKDCILVHIDEENYNRCVEFSKIMWARKKKKSNYNSGIINSNSDPIKTERTGNLGEMAISLAFNLPVDFTYKEYGSKIDFSKNGLIVDIKTAAKEPSYKKNFIRCINERGTYIPLTSDIYVSAFIKEDNGKTAQVVLVGYHTKEQIIKQIPVPALRGTHQNYELSYKDCYEIETLFIEE